MVHAEKLAHLCGYLLLAGNISACSGAEPATEEADDIERVQNALAVPDKVFTDGSGDVTIQVRTCDYPANASTGSRCQFCAVDQGWVMIGGGAEIEGSPSNARLRSSMPNPNSLTAPVHSPDAGELCTGNVPNNDPAKFYTAWMARSEGTSSYRMRTYVIGLKVAGMTEAQLRGYVSYRDSTTAALVQPSIEQESYSDHLLVGGGADEVGSRNCFLTESRPNTATNGWRASAYCSSAPGSLKSYGIFLDPCLPAPGWTECMSSKTRSLTVGNYPVSSVATPFPWVTTGIGGLGVVNRASSRFLTDLLPVVDGEQEAFVTTKEAGAWVSGSTTAYAINVLGGRRGTYRHNVVQFASPVGEGGGLALARSNGAAPVSLRQATLADSPVFRWSLESLGGGQYRLRNANPNVPAEGECAFRQPGTSNIQVGPCGTTNEYKWTFVGNPWTPWFGFKLRNVSSSTCLDNNNSTTTGTVLGLAACTDSFFARQSLLLRSLNWPG